MSNGIKVRQKALNVFSINFHSEQDDCTYQGEFTSKKLGIKELAVLGVRKAQLNGGMHYDKDAPGYGVDSGTDEFNSMIAHLELAIVKAPKWWNLDEITDVELVGKVYKEVVSFENSFRGRNRSDANESNESGRGSEGNSETQDSVTYGSRGVRTMVDQEVQSALEP